MESIRRVAKKNTVPKAQTSKVGVNVLKVDKDCFVDKEWLDAYVEVIMQICDNYDLTVQTIKMCNSKKKGLHFYITISPPIDSMIANMLQWLLGDDCRRVDFNRARIESNLDEWNKLFEVANRRLKTIYRKPKND
jgi:hypothetical protein